MLYVFCAYHLATSSFLTVTSSNLCYELVKCCRSFAQTHLFSLAQFTGWGLGNSYSKAPPQHDATTFMLHSWQGFFSDFSLDLAVRGFPHLSAPGDAGLLTVHVQFWYLYTFLRGRIRGVQSYALRAGVSADFQPNQAGATPGSTCVIS